MAHLITLPSLSTRKPGRRWWGRQESLESLFPGKTIHFLVSQDFVHPGLPDRTTCACPSCRNRSSEALLSLLHGSPKHYDCSCFSCPHNILLTYKHWTCKWQEKELLLAHPALSITSVLLLSLSAPAASLGLWQHEESARERREPTW